MLSLVTGKHRDGSGVQTSSRRTVVLPDFPAFFVSAIVLASFLWHPHMAEDRPVGSSRIVSL